MVYEKEITVEIDCGLEKLEEILNKNYFKIKEEYDIIDIYMIKKDYVLDNNYLETLKQCVLIRDIIEKEKESKFITYKYKEYNDLGEIIKQGKTDCEVESTEKAKELLENIGYTQLMKIKDHIIIYYNDTTELAVQLVNDKHIYIEIEDKCNYIDKQYLSIDDMKKDIQKYDIPIKNNNYFVKKAEIELKETLNSNIIDNIENRQYISKIVDVKIDRPFGSKHPKHNFIYPINYGFIPNTVSGDGEELDCYVLGVFEPIDSFKGKCIAIIHRINDNDDKLIIVPEGVDYSDDAINALTEFQEKYFEHIIIR